MAGQNSYLTWRLMISLTFAALVGCRASEDNEKVYIVYMGDLPKADFSATTFHTNVLRQVVGSRASEALLHSYQRSFNGFVAKLTEEESMRIAAMEGVVSVFRNTKMQLLTTRSWDFIGFPKEVKRSKIESDIIVGMIDTGIWPESKSFSDKGFGPPPKKWKGTCQTSQNFTCNNKIIGAKFCGIDGARRDSESPRDSMGHGTHTSSTAAGALVSHANLFDLGLGTARGGVPSARIAVYSVCYPIFGCLSSSILAAFDDAIADGVDIISISLGSDSQLDYFKDPISIGAFHAMKNGILTSNGAGNNGPHPATVTNTAPWSLTVAASTIGRKFTTKVQLGNNKFYDGVSINTFHVNKMHPFVYGGDIPNTAEGYSRNDSRYCAPGSLDKALVKGKIVLCDTLVDGEDTLASGAIGTIMQDDGPKDLAYTFPLPASYLSLKDGKEVSLYINSTRKPTATIWKSVGVQDTLAPSVASFSSRGPNPITMDILKPDLTAPGVDILASWSEATSVTGLLGDKRLVPFNIVSGTSMACPHATGAAAYVKSFHPAWSPAALKSALMTTASPLTSGKSFDAEFGYGAGQIDPMKAAHPGLVYDAEEADYVKFLCGSGYDTKHLRLVTGDKNTCSASNNGTVWDLNYPSFTLSAASGKSVTRVFHRTVTNVGLPMSTYKAVVTAPSGLKIIVTPSALSFKSIGQKQSFVVTVRASASGKVLSGSLVWDDGKHQVRSPIVAHALPS